MSIPLLRLPLLASTKVIKYIDATHLIPLILLSKKAKNLVKVSKVHTKLTVSQFSIQFQKLARQGTVRGLECVDLSENSSKNLPFEPPCHSEFETRTQYRIRAYKKVLDDFVEFFKVCSVSFDLDSVCSYTSFCFMEYAKDLGLKFSFARVVIGGANGKVYQNLLKVCSNASQLLVLYDTREQFTFDGFTENSMDILRITTIEYQIEQYFLTFESFNWFTVDHMCALVNCSKVSVKGLNWRSKDFNRFIKFWMGSDGKLQLLVLKKSVRQLQIFPQLMMSGINNREIGFRAYEIQRTDGVKAKVEYEPWLFRLTVIDA